MDYIIGSLVTIATVVIVNKTISRQLKAQETIPTIKYRQSYIYDLLKPYLIKGMTGIVPKDNLRIINTGHTPGSW
jgi:hypothetical protein